MHLPVLPELYANITTIANVAYSAINRIHLGSLRISHRLQNTKMHEFIGNSFVEGELNDFFAALDSWIDPQQATDDLFAPIHQNQYPTDDFFARPILQNQYPTDGVLQFNLLSEKNDSVERETPDVNRFEPLPTGPAAPNFSIHPECTKLREPIASIDNRPQPPFAGIEIYCPKRESNEVDAEKEHSKPTKKRKISQTKKPKAIDDGNRKRAEHGNTCVRCKLQKGKAC